MKETNLTCITCPMGCAITVTQDENGAVVSVTGNTCRRGEVYARNEVTHPVRTLTTTVLVENRPHTLCPVRTDAPISKERLFEAMAAVRELRITAPVKIGTVLVENFLGEANLIATGNID